MMRRKGISAGIGALLIVSVLIISTLGLGVAIQQRVTTPPEFDLRIGGFHLLAVILQPTHSSAVAISTYCAPRWVGCCIPRQEFYLVWVITLTGGIDREQQVGTRLLTLPLPCT